MPQNNTESLILLIVGLFIFFGYKKLGKFLNSGPERSLWEASPIQPNLKIMIEQGLCLIIGSIFIVLSLISLLAP